MAADFMNETMRRSGEILHGGALRLATRAVVPGVALPQHVSWYEIDPGGACSPHVHTGKTETWLIVAGRGRAVLGEAEYEVGEGDLLVAWPGTQHALHNTGTVPLRFVNIVATDGREPVTTREIESE